MQAEVGWELRLAATIGETAGPTVEELHLIRDEVDPQGMTGKNSEGSRDERVRVTCSSRRIATSKDVFKLQLVKWEKTISDFLAAGLD